MREVAASPDAELQIIATNSHLSPEFGMTVNEIEADGFKVDVKIASLEPGGDSKATVKSMANVMNGMAEALENLKPDLVVVLGDRYETLAAASAAVAFNIPIAHLHGGETTEGAIDDKFRHAITQLSDYHFASTPQYVEKVLSLGAHPYRVFHSGAPGAEDLSAEEEASATSTREDALPWEFYQKTGLQPGEEFIILAIHPVTMAPDKGESEVNATLEALKTFINRGYKILLTMPNSDPGSVRIIEMLNEWAAKYPEKVIAVKSLGSKLFHYALEEAQAIIGNSSAALIEAPSRRLPTVNVGIRQKGRARGITVFDVPGEKEKIEEALQSALSMEMKAILLGMHVSGLNPYFKENSAAFIADKLIHQNFKL